MFTISVSDFRDALQRVASIAPRKSPLQSLERVHMDVHEFFLSLTASDGATTVHTRFPVKQTGDGFARSVNAHWFTDAVKALPDGMVSVELVNTRLALTTDSGRALFPTYDPPDDRDGSAVSGRATTFTMERVALAEMITAVSYAVSTDEFRPAMTGVFFEADGNALTITATDGFRMAWARREMPVTAFSAVVPPSALAATKNLTGGSIALTNVSTGDNAATLAFSDDDTTITTACIREAYPNWQRVIPTAHKYETRVDRAALLDALGRVGLFASKQTQRVTLAIADNALTLTSQDEDTASEARETLPCDHTGGDLRIAFNVRFLRETLRRVPDEAVRMRFESALRPVVIAPAVQPSGWTLDSLVMPIRLDA